MDKETERQLREVIDANYAGVVPEYITWGLRVLDMLLCSDLDRAAAFLHSKQVRKKKKAHVYSHLNHCIHCGIFSEDALVEGTEYCEVATELELETPPDLEEEE